MSPLMLLMLVVVVAPGPLAVIACKAQYDYSRLARKGPVPYAPEGKPETEKLQETARTLGGTGEALSLLIEPMEPPIACTVKITTLSSYEGQCVMVNKLPACHAGNFTTPLDPVCSQWYQQHKSEQPSH